MTIIQLCMSRALIAVGPSAQPLDSSTRLLQLSALPTRVFVLLKHVRGVSLSCGSSSSTIMVVSFSRRLWGPSGIPMQMGTATGVWYPDRDLNCLLGRYRIYCLLL